jgi:hypothetical protein
MEKINKDKLQEIIDFYNNGQYQQMVTKINVYGLYDVFKHLDIITKKNNSDLFAKIVINYHRNQYIYNLGEKLCKK